MKLLFASTIIVPAYHYPTYFLAISIALLVLIDLYKHYLNHVQQRDVKVLPPTSKALTGDSKTIVCAQMPNLDSWSYNDLSTQCRLLKLKGNNRKKQTLIKLLQEV